MDPNIEVRSAEGRIYSLAARSLNPRPSGCVIYVAAARGAPLMRSLPRDSSVTLHRLDRPLARAHGSIVSQLLPALFDLYPRGFTGHVAHPGRSIRRGEDQRPQGGDKATALALAERAIAALQKLLSIPYSGPLASNVPLTPARSGSIRCSIRCGMIRVSKNSPPRPRQNRKRQGSDSSPEETVSQLIGERLERSRRAGEGMGQN